MMLDQDAMQIARKRLNAESPKRQHFFHRELQRVQGELAAKGLAHSGALIQAVADVCAREIEDATERLWEIVRELLGETVGAPSADAIRTLFGQIDELWVPYCADGPQRQFDAICLRDGIANGPLMNATRLHDRSIGAHMRIQSQVEEYIRSRRLSAEKQDNVGIGIPKVFLSHAASDEQIALLINAEIERRLPGVKAFCSSDPTDLPPGSKWSPEIQQALRESAVLIFIASQRGLQRPWVWFECGTFWFSGKKIIPLCLGEIRKNALPPPLSELQAINGEEPDDLKIVLDVIGAATGVTGSNAGLRELSERLKQLDQEAASVVRVKAGWIGTDWKERFLAYDGPYEGLKEVSDRNFETSMQGALEAAGYRVALYDRGSFASMDDPAHFVWLTDRKSWRCRIARGTAYLVARPVS